MALWQHGHSMALNAATAPLRSAEQAIRCVESESLRLGIPGIAPALVAGWSGAPAFSAGMGLEWASVVRAERSEAVSTAKPVEQTA